MPLSQPEPRTLVHRREIEILGYRRDDGLFDIEAQLVDTKTFAFVTLDRGEMTPGTKLHQMLARMTVDEDMLIHRFEAATEFAPYPICPSAAPNFADLAGLRIGRGFLKAVQERVGGVHGCTHIRELLGQMGTVAFQTMFRQRRGGDGMRASMVNSCLAYEDGGVQARRTWPERYADPTPS